MQELVSPDMSELNHAVMKQKTRRSNAAFSSKKIRKKRMDSSSFLLTHHIARWMELQNIKRYVINSSVLQEIFHLSKFLSCSGEKTWSCD